MLSDTFNERIRGYYERASIPKINRSQLFEAEIPLPPLATQQAIVAEIEAEQALVAANRELIARFEKKIQCHPRPASGAKTRRLRGRCERSIYRNDTANARGRRRDP